jgi:hypothetical protein
VDDNDRYLLDINKDVRHARGQIVGLPRCGFGPAFGVTLPSLPVEFGWPIGMPVRRPLGDGLFCCPRRVGSTSANLNPTPLLPRSDPDLPS